MQTFELKIPKKNSNSPTVEKKVTKILICINFYLISLFYFCEYNFCMYKKNKKKNYIIIA